MQAQIHATNHVMEGRNKIQRCHSMLLTLSRTSCDHVSGHILQQYHPPSVLQALQIMFPNPDLDEYGFNVLHDTVLCFNSLTIEEAFERGRSMIDQMDKFGRTPLAWAASRGDLNSLNFLVQNGADVRSDISPLSLARMLGRHHCVKVLLNMEPT